MNTKSITSSVIGNYSNSLSRLTTRFLANMNNIDVDFNARNKEIEEETKKKKNSADASAKVALKNAKGALLEKGLSRSGESVQAELDNSLMKANAMSAIDSDAEKSKRANEEARMNAKNTAVIDYMDRTNELEEKKNKALREEAAADREFEAKREDEYFDRYLKNREFEAEREDEAFDRYLENRDFEAERDDEAFDRSLENKKFSADREDEYFDRLKSSEEKEVKEEKEEKIEPRYNPKTLVDKIFTNSRKTAGGTKAAYEMTKKAINEILNDESISYSYRYQVRLYAKAMGYI